MIEPNLALSQLEVFFDGPAQAAHPSHLRQRHCLRRVREVVLEVLGLQASHRPANHHPGPGPGSVVALFDHPYAGELVLARAFGALPHSMSNPDLVGQPGGQLGNRRRRRRARSWLLTAPPSTQPASPWDLPARVAAPDLGVAADLEAVPPVLFADQPPELVAVSVGGISGHPPEGQLCSLGCRCQHLLAQLQLGLEDQTLRQACPFAPECRLRLKPALGHVEATIHQRVAVLGGVAQKDADLAVIHPTQRARVLAGHPGRPDPFLGKAGVVQDQDPISRAHLLAHEALQFLDTALLVPGRVAQELLQLARRSPNLLRNVLHVLTLDRESVVPIRYLWLQARASERTKKRPNVDETSPDWAAALAGRWRSRLLSPLRPPP